MFESRFTQSGMANIKLVASFFILLALVVMKVVLDGSSYKTTDVSSQSIALDIENRPVITTKNPHSDGAAEGQRKNVLFIIDDDLRSQLGVYFDRAHPNYFSKVQIQTPNLDKFASRSLVFKRAYVQYSLCGPSRTSLLTSRRPDVTQIYNNRRYWRKVGGNFTTLPEHFKNNGYLTAGFGKVFHGGRSSNNDDPPSWTEPYQNPRTTEEELLPNGRLTPWLAVSESEMQRRQLVDMNITNMAISLLENISKTTNATRQPFFIAIGYHRPHRSMICPSKYHDLYPLEEEREFLANISWQQPTIRGSVDMEGIETADGRRYLPSDNLRKVRRAYFACISYIDDLVGKVLRSLDEFGLANNTIVIFMADHGFHLGENGQWAKILTTEVANRIPLIIRIPGLTDSGMTSSSIVEAVDVFPTVVEAAGLQALPSCPLSSSNIRLCTQGSSLMPIFRNPDHNIKDAAFSQIWMPKGMKYTIRTKNFRLVDRVFITSKTVAGVLKRSVTWLPNTTYTELYDYRNDVMEQINLANSSEYRNIMLSLRTKLFNFIKKQIL